MADLPAKADDAPERALAPHRDAEAAVEAARSMLASAVFERQVPIALLTKLASDESVPVRERRRCAEVLARLQLKLIETVAQITGAKEQRLKQMGIDAAAGDVHMTQVNNRIEIVREGAVTGATSRSHRSSPRTTDVPSRIYLSAPMAHQIDVLRDPARSKVLACGRRWGKTKTGELACVEGHGPREGGHRGALDGGNIWWVAPSYPIANMIWRSLKTSLKDGWETKNENDRRIVLPGGGSISVKSADNPDSLRGDGLDGCVLDEAAFMKKDAWAACIRPALSDKRGWAMFLTTPNGLNWFHDIWQDVPNRKGWKRWQRPTSDNPLIDDDELDAARREVGPYLFSQEYEAQFLTAGGGLFKVDWFEHRFDPVGEDHYLLEGGPTIHRDNLIRFATVDLATSTKTTADYTVVATFGKAPDGRLLLLDVDRARREGPDLVPAMKRAAARWRSRVVYIERTGFQLAIVQQARAAGVPVRELLPDKDKVARALPVTAALEGGRLLLPRTAPWLDEFVSEMLGFPEAPHDDQVDAVSYGVEAAKDIRRPSFLSLSKSLDHPDPDDPDWDETPGYLDLPRGALARRRQWQQIMGDLHLRGAG